MSPFFEALMIILGVGFIQFAFGYLKRWWKGE